MSFVEKEDVMNEIEGLAKYVFKNVTGEEANLHFSKECLMQKLWIDLVLINQI